MSTENFRSHAELQNAFIAMQVNHMVYKARKRMDDFKYNTVKAACSKEEGIQYIIGYFGENPLDYVKILYDILNENSEGTKPFISKEEIRTIFTCDSAQRFLLKAGPSFSGLGSDADRKDFIVNNILRPIIVRCVGSTYRELGIVPEDTNGTQFIDV